MKTFLHPNKKGFTIMEILVVIAIISLLVIISFQAFKGLDDRKKIKSSTEMIQAVLDDAKSNATLGKSNTSHGVHFATSSIILFEGSSFDEDDSSNVTFYLDDGINISSYSFNGGADDIIFDQLTGETMQYGTINIVLESDNNASSTISVSRSGFIDIIQ